MESSIADFNSRYQEQHRRQLEAFAAMQDLNGAEMENVIRAIMEFTVAIPSWALGTGGTRFGRFAGGGEPATLEQKIDDVSLIRKLTGATNSVSLHIPWDIPADAAALREQLSQAGLTIDAVNSNTFQDQKGQSLSYKFGSLCHTDPAIRQQAIAHNLEVIDHGKAIGSKCLSVWLSDGSDFPGQQHFRRAYERTQDALRRIYEAMPADWTMLIEYKPYEPHFYSMVIPDWGTSLQLCNACGKNAHVLVDLGHHLPNTNIEQVVARLLHFGRLGGFHFNGSQYGDDDLTTGAIKPYQLFLIFVELVSGVADTQLRNPGVAYMIDASHNIKDPLEDLMNSLESIRTAYAKALLVNYVALHQAQDNNDPVRAESLLQQAFLADVRPLLREARLRANACIDPIGFFREQGIRAELVRRRGATSVATGL